MKFELKIEKGIPVPQRNRGKYIDAVNQMEKGDSILFPNRGAAMCFYCTTRRMKVKTFMRKDGDGVRVWRASSPNAKEPILPTRRRTTPHRKHRSRYQGIGELVVKAVNAAGGNPVSFWDVYTEVRKTINRVRKHCVRSSLATQVGRGEIRQAGERGDLQWTALAATA